MADAKGEDSYEIYSYAPTDSLLEIELESTPMDGVSCVNWSPVDPNALLVGSWDSVSTRNP